MSQALTKAGFSSQKTLRYMAEQGLIDSETEKRPNGQTVSRNTVVRRFAGKRARVVQFNIGMLAETVDSLEEQEDENEERYQPQLGSPQTSMEQWTEVDADDDLPF